MKRLALYICLFFLTLSAWAVNTADLVTNPVGLNVLQKKCIRLGTSEVLPIQFETACIVLKQQDLLPAVQEEFARSISEDGTVDFPVFETDPGTYYYINENGKRTDIVELYRKQTDEHSFNFIVMASGKRFFGRYDVIIHLQVVDAGPAGIIYSVKVHAYPHNWLTRTSHKIGLTRGFFKKKMQLISWVAREIATGLCEQEEKRHQLTGGSSSTSTSAPPSPGGTGPSISKK
ncbi:hypothetical protein P4C99_05685 [Pontiellaceae bacterium B1224]|nr:hypothetical protein [Pontiellaceae bacterium B1224]